MENPLEKYFPFFTRSQLDDKIAPAFSLRVDHQSTVTQTLTLRGLTKNGVFTYRFSTVNDGILTSNTFRITDVPIFVSVETESATALQGQTYASLHLLANNDRLFQMCAGNVYAQKGISWPTNTTVDAMPGRGIIKTNVSADPAAGAEVDHSVPVGRIWHILAGSIVLVTDATAANRRVHLICTAPSGMVADSRGITDQAASQTRTYHFGKWGHILDGDDNNRIHVGLQEDLYLVEGSTIVTETLNIQAGDNYGTLRLLIEEFFMPTAG